MLPMSVAQSSSDMFTIGRITYRREGIFFPIENALSAGKGEWQCTAKYAMYDCFVACCRLITAKLWSVCVHKINIILLIIIKILLFYFTSADYGDRIGADLGESTPILYGAIKLCLAWMT